MPNGGLTMGNIVGILGRVLGAVVSGISPELRTLVKDNVAKWERWAKDSKNPFDDMLVAVVKAVFDV